MGGGGGGVGHDGVSVQSRLVTSEEAGREGDWTGWRREVTMGPSLSHMTSHCQPGTT